jgi:excisionase family DNA binding protein
MLYTLESAADATGLNKSTILRAIKSGRIAATKNDLGRWHIEAEDLHRVYSVARERAFANQIEDLIRRARHRLQQQLAGVRSGRFIEPEDEATH